MTSRRLSPSAIVFLVVFIDLLGFGIVIPLLPLYAERFGPSPIAFGLLMSSYSAMQLVFAPILGRLSDRFGRRPVLLLSLLGTVAGYLLFAFADSLALLFASRILDGATGGNIGTAQAVIADTTSESDRARGMGLIGMAFGLGFVFGPAIGGFAVTLHPAAPGLFAAGLSALAFLWALVGLPETRPAGGPRSPFGVLSPASLGKTFRRPGIGPLMAVSLLAAVAFSAFEATFSQFLSLRFGFSPATVASVFVAVGVTAAVVQGGLIRRLAPRFGERRLLAAGLAVLLAAFGLLLAARSVPVLMVAVVALAAGSGFASPSLLGLVSRRTPPTEQGEVLGAFQSTAALGRIAGPFWGELVYFRFGPPGPHVTGLVLEAAALAVAMSLSRGDDKIRPTDAPRAPGS